MRLALLLVAAFAAPVPAQDLGGGAPASHGRVPRFAMSTWVPTQPARLSFTDVPASFAFGLGIVSLTSTSFSFPGIAGTIIADPSGILLPMGQSLALGALPPSLRGISLFVQGVVFDTVSGASMTDATRANFFQPLAMVGNQRQSANSLSVVDVLTGTVIQRIPDSESGRIAYSPDRTRAYVCEPGLMRNRVVVYDVTVNPIQLLTTVATSGGIRYRGEFNSTGTRLYVPVHDAIDVIDTDPSSGTFHQLVARISVPIIGNPGSIFTGPIDLAITPDDRRLLIAYGESLLYPARSTVGVIDLTLPNFPHRAISITTGGTVFDLATHDDIEVSPDGSHAYVLEFGFPPGFPFVLGFANGGLVSVIDLATETEVRTIPTDGVGQQEFALDFLGRNLWVPQTNLDLTGEVLRIDTDRRSATRHTILARVQADPLPFTLSSGPRGVGATPDGGRVFVSIVEDGTHPVPVLIEIAASSNSVVGVPITVESLPSTVALQQR
jgi:DNA-binding beta-propeller fold protein YncE